MSEPNFATQIPPTAEDAKRTATCANCRYAEPLDNGGTTRFFSCRVNPPTDNFKWPTVRATDWCGRIHLLGHAYACCEHEVVVGFAEDDNLANSLAGIEDQLRSIHLSMPS